MDIKQMIDNASDQVRLYSEEIATTVQEIKRKYGYSESFALDIIRTAIESMKLDCMHHNLKVMDRETDAIQELSEAAKEISGSGWALK